MSGMGGAIADRDAGAIIFVGIVMLIFAAAGCFASWCAGAGHGREVGIEEFRAEAVKAGAATWEPDERGQPRFVWNTPAASP